MYRTFWAFSGHSIFAEKKLFVVALVPETQLVSGKRSPPTSFLGGFS
jgi:hypothetical protein